MSIHYELISENNIICIKDSCNDLMAYQKSQTHIRPELFDSMSFETRMMPSVKSAKANYILVGGCVVTEQKTGISNPLFTKCSCAM